MRRRFLNSGGREWKIKKCEMRNKIQSLYMPRENFDHRCNVNWKSVNYNWFAKFRYLRKTRVAKFQIKSWNNLIFYYFFFFFFFNIYLHFYFITLYDRIDFLIPKIATSNQSEFQQFYLRAKLVNCRITNELPRRKYFHKAKLVRGRGFVSLGIIVSKLRVRYFQPGTGTAISASITLLFLFSYVFHFPGDHPFNNPLPPSLPPCTTGWARISLRKKLEIFRTNEHFWRGPAFPYPTISRVRHGVEGRREGTEHFYAFVQTRTTVNTCRQTMKSNDITVQR